MAKLFALKEKCMALTASGTRCKNGGTQRHDDAVYRYAVCGQHGEMIMAGKHVAFACHITAENLASTINQARLPGLDSNVQTAREALSTPTGDIEVEIFYVRGIEPGKVLLLHKEVINVKRWAKSIILVEAITHMPNIEGRITGIMIRHNNNKAVWNRAKNGWVPRPVPTNLIIVKKENK